MKRQRTEVPIKLDDMPQELIQEISMFLKAPDIRSLLTVNKYFHAIISSPQYFYGSKLCVFPIGRQEKRLLYECEEIPDDYTLRLLLGNFPPEKYPVPANVPSSEKRFGYLASSIEEKNRKPIPPMYYVRNVMLVERGLFFRNEDFEEIFRLFPNITGLFIRGARFATNQIFDFAGAAGLSSRITTLDVSRCARLTPSFFTAHPDITNNLEFLKVSNLFSEVTNAKFTFKKLKRLSFGPPRPSINTETFSTVFDIPAIEEIIFDSVLVLLPRQMLSNDDEELFVEAYPNLRRLQIIDVEVADPRLFYSRFISKLKNLTDLEIDGGLVFDDVVGNLRALKRLKLRGGIDCTLSREIFNFLPNLDSLDLTEFAGVFIYDGRGGTLSQQDVNYFSGLREFKLCCNVNIAKLLREAGEDNVDAVISDCGCQGYLQSSLFNLDLMRNTIDIDNIDRYVHFSCKACDTCARCGDLQLISNSSNLKDCKKLVLKKCDNCERKVCKRISCENCFRSFCPCVRVYLRWGFCGDDCGCEKMCSFCIKELVPCGDSRCNQTVCTDCCSMCKVCEKILCNEECVDTADFDEDSETFEEDYPIGERICKKCKGQRQLL